MTSTHDQHQASPAGRDEHSPHHGGHGWVMMICCIPMLVIAIALVATGVANISFIFIAIMCTVMMAMMMRMMGSGSGHA